MKIIYHASFTLLVVTKIFYIIYLLGVAFSVCKVPSLLINFSLTFVFIFFSSLPFFYFFPLFLNQENKT